MGVLSNTWRHIRRTPYQAFAAVSMMLLTFTVGGLFLIVSLGSTIVLRSFEQKPQIIVYFKDTKKEADIQKLEQQLRLMNKVANVKFISKEEALAIYQKQFKNDPLLLEMVSADILPASIEVSAVKIEFLSELAELLKKEPDVEDIVFQKEVVDLLVSWTRAVKQVGIFLVLFLGFVSLFTVITVVGMKIALKREEIEILQLVGASPWYIRIPFILEGMVYGAIGALIGTGIDIGILVYTSPFLASLFVGIPLFPLPSVFLIVFAAGMVITGILLGFFASSLAINRYLR